MLARGPVRLPRSIQTPATPPKTKASSGPAQAALTSIKPRQRPSSPPSLTSPMPMPPARFIPSRKAKYAEPAIIATTGTWPVAAQCNARPASAKTKPGKTNRFGRRCSAKSARQSSPVTIARKTAGTRAACQPRLDTASPPSPTVSAACHPNRAHALLSRVAFAVLVTPAG